MLFLGTIAAIPMLQWLLLGPALAAIAYSAYCCVVIHFLIFTIWPIAIVWTDASSRRPRISVFMCIMLGFISVLANFCALVKYPAIGSFECFVLMFLLKFTMSSAVVYEASMRLRSYSNVIAGALLVFNLPYVRLFANFETLIWAADPHWISAYTIWFAVFFINAAPFLAVDSAPILISTILLVFGPSVQGNYGYWLQAHVYSLGIWLNCVNTWPKWLGCKTQCPSFWSYFFSICSLATTIFATKIQKVIR